MSSDTKKRSLLDCGKSDPSSKKTKKEDSPSAEVPNKQVNEIDIKLTDVLGMEHAVTTLKNSVQKIIEQAPDYDELVKFMESVDMQSVDMEDTVKKEIFIALSRTNNVKLASKLKSFYEDGKLSAFDFILKFSEDESTELLNSNITLTSGSNLDILSKRSKAQYHEKPYPPPLPQIKNPVILSRVFMHKSVVNDKRYLSNRQMLMSHNERLEFLGDSILNNLVTLIIFERFPDYNEGELSKLRIECVNNSILTNWSKLYDFDKELRRNISDSTFGTGKMKIYADVFEAYIGGLVTDNMSMQEIRLWLLELVEPVLNSYQSKVASQHEIPLNKNAKLELYSLIGCAAMPPRYETVQSGDGTVMPFIVSCLIKDDELGRGEGQNIKEAGLKLAMLALENKPLIEKYSMIRRKMPRSISVTRGSEEPVAEINTNTDTNLNSNSNSNSESLEERALAKLESLLSLPPLPTTKFTVDESKLPLHSPQSHEYAIDNTSKGTLYSVLGKQHLRPEYDTQKLRDGNVKVILSINNIPFVSSVHRSGKLAGQQAAQYLLENLSVLRDFGVLKQS